MVVYNTLIPQLKTELKLKNCDMGKINYDDEQKHSYIKHTVYNFLPTPCQTDKHTALSFGLDHHIPTKSKDVATEVEFEQFYKGLLRNLTLILRAAGVHKILANKLSRSSILWYSQDTQINKP